MNSRERVKKVLEHKIPDKIPIDFGATPGTSISPISYKNLRNRLNLGDEEIKIPNFLSQAVYPEKEILDMFNVDIIDSGRAFVESMNWKKWELKQGMIFLIPDFIKIEVDSEGNSYLKNRDGNIVAKKTKNSLYFEEYSNPYKNLDSIPAHFDEKDLKGIYWDIPFLPFHLNIFNNDEFETFVKNIRNLYENTDKAISLLVMCDLIESGKSLRGMENFLCDIYEDRKGTERLLDVLLERNLKKLDRVLKGVGDYIDIVRFVDDLGFQAGPFISPEKYREIFKPRHKKMWDFVHNNSNCSVSLHSCGSIYKLIPDLIDAGVDVLNPVQTSAADMEPDKLKIEFGRDLIFWGGCGDTQNVLPTGTSEDVKIDTKKRIEILGDKGGLIFAHINTIQEDVPPENIISMLKTINNYREYI